MVNKSKRLSCSPIRAMGEGAAKEQTCSTPGCNWREAAPFFLADFHFLQPSTHLLLDERESFWKVTCTSCVLNPRPSAPVDLSYRPLMRISRGLEHNYYLSVRQDSVIVIDALGVSSAISVFDRKLNFTIEVIRGTLSKKRAGHNIDIHRSLTDTVLCH